MMNDFLFIYLSGGFSVLSLMFVMYIHDKRRGLRWGKKDFVVFPLGFALSWVAFVWAIWCYIKEIKND